MIFSWELNLGHAITLGLTVVALIGAWVTLKIQSATNEKKIEALDKELEGRTTALDTRVDAYGNALADLRLHVERETVKKGDLEKVEDRITKRLDTVEHTIRNSQTIILSAVTAMAPRNRGRAPE